MLLHNHTMCHNQSLECGIRTKNVPLIQLPLFLDRFIPVGVSGRVLGLILAAWGRQGTPENESPAHHRAVCELNGTAVVF